MKTMIAAWISVELAQAVYDRATEQRISRSAAIAEALAAYCNRPELATGRTSARAALNERAEAYIRANPHLTIRATVDSLAEQGIDRKKSWVAERRQRLTAHDKGRGGQNV